MNMQKYFEDKDFVIHLQDMARKYDSSLLRKVADRFDELVEEKRDNEFKSIRMETI